jgi:hypothetical protein
MTSKRKRTCEIKEFCGYYLLAVAIQGIHLDMIHRLVARSAEDEPGEPHSLHSIIMRAIERLYDQTFDEEDHPSPA